ncbi:MAG: Type I transmembrane sorting receptor [Thelocarpon superellum]|nr:MAG: Type I transmembrane sorting receptor [Thelocarpon superellum]
MQLLSKIVLASAALSSLASATPVEKRNNRFSVKQEVNSSFKSKSGPAALAKALGKYNATMPPAVVAAAGNDGTEPAQPTTYDEEYLCPVSIGGQKLSLDFDTGSSDLWVFSSELPQASQANHNAYSPRKSKSFKSLSGYTWSIQYGDGSGASGDVGTDTVVVGGTTVAAQAVELAKQVSSSFSQGTGDGLLGLGFSSINTVQPQQQKTFFDNAASSLDAPIFTADLRHNQPGSYDFGFIDDTKYTGSINYTPVNSAQGFWEFSSTGYQVGSGAFKSQSIDAIADTGTTLFLTDDAIVSDYYSQVQGAQNDQTQGGYTFPCSASLPDFTFGVGAYRAVISGSLINYAPVDANTCFGGIQSNQGLGMSIFGDIMFKSQFVIFDGGNTQLGFAAKP